MRVDISRVGSASSSTGDDTTVNDDVGPLRIRKFWNAVPTVPAVIGTLIRVLKECCEFRDLGRLGVDGKNYVLVVHLHSGWRANSRPDTN
jgi:hypothetical protein